ncbi:hypothetical protein [Bradyrhizobium sp. 27S5]|uniref:hypothetical protein n=1 Tax=Bradyrhizobium sp. 27S5 TaxID=3139728 RepID=UPI0030D136BA
MIMPVRRNWNPDELFHGLTMLTAEPSVVRARWDKLWPDLYTEYDATHQRQELQVRNLDITDDAEAFFQAGRPTKNVTPMDSSASLNLSLTDPKTRYARYRDTRSHDFDPIGAHLNDEFSLMVMIAFDEMCTCPAYAAEKSFYDGLGNDTFHYWLRESDCRRGGSLNERR